MTYDCNNLLFSSILCWWRCHQDLPRQVHSVGQFPGLTGLRWPKSSAWDRILSQLSGDESPPHLSDLLLPPVVSSDSAGRQ